ncbi:MAG: GNAT family N-acetyltransferase [Saccharofermentanales bacterium]|jgi:ElaA protein
MKTIIKHYEMLSKDELYQILQARAAIFVVEQDCPYQDLDNKDQNAIHVWLADDQGIQAYCRVLDRGVTFEEVTIGRVITVKRGAGLGFQLMQEAIATAVKYYNAESVRISSQVYAKGFYEKSGFVQDSEEYLEDNIPHIQMYLRIEDNLPCID